MADYSFHTFAPDVLVFDTGTGTFVLDAGYDETTDRNLVEYSDDDARFDGVFDDVAGNPEAIEDTNQIGTAYDDLGNVVVSGQVYAAAYAVLEDSSGNTVMLDRIEIDGVHVGYVPSAPLEPGVTYTVTSSQMVSSSDGSSLDHSYYEANSVPCFDAGTLIATPNGPRVIAEIREGDLVETLDAGPQPIIWRSVKRRALAGCPDADFPIVIPAGVLGGGRPSSDLVVSAQHRILLGRAAQASDYLPTETLVPAKALLGVIPGVRLMRGRRHATWVHLALADHAILTANGAYAESLLFGPVAWRGIAPLRRIGLRQMAGQGLISLPPAPARPCPGASAAHRAIVAWRSARKCLGSEENCRL